MSDLTDNDPITFGKHKGKAMVEVPAGWLLWFYGENEGVSTVKLYPDQKKVMEYIRENLDAIKSE